MPARELLTKPIAERAIEHRQRRHVADPLAVRRIARDEPRRIARGRTLEMRDVLSRETDKTLDAGGLRVVAGLVQHARIAVVTEEHRRQRAKTCIGALPRVVDEPRPERRVVSLPA